MEKNIVFNGLGVLGKPAALLTNPSGLTELSFTVKDAGGVLPRATVQIDNQFYSTNDFGQFKKDNINPFSQIIISFVGYKPFLSRAKDVPVNVELSEDMTVLQGVTIVKPKSKSFFGWFLATAAVVAVVASSGKKEKQERVKIKSA